MALTAVVQKGPTTPSDEMISVCKCCFSCIYNAHPDGALWNRNPNACASCADLLP